MSQTTYWFYTPEQVTMDDDSIQLDFHDGMVLSSPEQFVPLATYMDNAMHTWTLFEDPGHYVMAAHAKYLPIYKVPSPHVLVVLLDFLGVTLEGTSVDEDL